MHALPANFAPPGADGSFRRLLCLLCCAAGLGLIPGCHRAERPPIAVAPQPAALVPPDVSTELLAQMAGCGGDAGTTQACVLLRDFTAGSAFTGCPGAGARTWFGVIHAVGGTGDGREVPYFLQVRASAPGGAGGMACEGSGRLLITQTLEEQADVTAVVTALRAGARPPSGSAALAYAQTASPAQGFRSVQRTTGTSAVIEGTVALYLRSAAGRLIAIEAGSGPLIQHPQAGIAANLLVGELWAVP